MKTIKILTALFIALVAMSSCTIEDNPALTPVNVDGEWYTEVAVTGVTYDMGSVDELIEVGYDHVGVKLSLEGGIGMWTHYYIKDGEMVNYDGGYDNLFGYSTMWNGSILVKSLNEFDNISFVDGMDLRYSNRHIVANLNGMNVVFNTPTAEEAAKMEKWDAIISDDHMGYEPDEITTDFDPNNATEPSRARRR